MKSEKPNIFECIDWLDNHQEWDSLYKYYVETLKNRKKILNLFWNPFFEEIKWKTKGIQKVLADAWYEDLDWSLKALIIDWIKFFLNLDYQIHIDDDIRFDDYYLWLFDSLGINTSNKKLLNEILSELEKWWKKLPESPINFLVNFDYNKRKKQSGLWKNKNKFEEEIENPGADELNRIIKDFWEKDYWFIKDLRTVWVKEDRLEYTFLVWLYGYIVKLVKGEIVDERKIDRIFNYYSIDISDKQLLLSLKDKIEKRFPELLSSTDERVKKASTSEKINKKPTHEMINEIRRELDKSKFWNNRLEWKIFIYWHCAFNDSPYWLKLFGEDAVKYENWDEYIPIDNTCVWEIWKIDPNKNPDSSFNMLWSYSNWDRFTVVRPTYSEYIKYDRERIKCWFVNVRSEKTWKIYRALSM